MLNYLRSVLETEDGKLVYYIVLIMIVMFIDFMTGLYKAHVTRTLSSKIGKDGLTKKLIIIMLLLIVIPVSLIIPSEIAGNGLIYVVYTGYLGFEFVSIFENCKAVGINLSWLKPIYDRLLQKKEVD